MPVIKYTGRKTDFKGKTLWEIIGSLRDFGVGRIVARSMFERYPEKSFMTILKIEALPNEDTRKVKVTVEKTFRGRTYPKPIVIQSASYKADYRLIPKSEETEYCKTELRTKIKILPEHIDFPPLLRELITEETGDPNPKMKLRLKTNIGKLCRLSKDGEKPNVEVDKNFMKPLCLRLYEGCS